MDRELVINITGDPSHLADDVRRYMAAQFQPKQPRSGYRAKLYRGTLFWNWTVTGVVPTPGDPCPDPVRFSEWWGWGLTEARAERSLRRSIARAERRRSRPERDLVVAP